MERFFNTDPLDGSKIYFHTPTAVSRRAFLYPICLGDFICDATYRISRRKYDSFLLMYVSSGQGYLNFRDTRCELQAQDFVFLDCYEPHSYGTDSFWHIEWIHFDGPSAREYYSMFRHLYGQKLHLSPSAARSILKPLRTLLDSFSMQKNLPELWLSKYLTDLLTYTLSISDGQTVSADTRDSTERALHYIQQNFQSPLTVEEIADYLSLNPSYFIRQFKKDTGMTPYQYLTSIRLERARYDLRTTARSVKDIGLSCGYQSENSFCITFRKATGMTPTQYRLQE